MRAYAQEAALLGATWFPPLERTVEDVQSSKEHFLAARADGRIAGAIGVEPDPEGLGITIASLVVDPCFQRQGMGRKLLEAVLAAHGDAGLTVQTGARNAPALALYEAKGFVVTRRWLVGREPLELVRLRRLPD
nr:GNAT family N-acetyltransferase [Ramlibacter paludis]